MIRPEYVRAEAIFYSDRMTKLYWPVSFDLYVRGSAARRDSWNTILTSARESMGAPIIE